MDDNTKSIDSLFKEYSERLDRVSKNGGNLYFINLEYSARRGSYRASIISYSREAYSLDSHTEDYHVNPDPVEALEGLRKGVEWIEYWHEISNQDN